MVKDAHLYTDTFGLLWAYEGVFPADPTKLDAAKIKFVCSPAPEYANLLSAAMVLYRVAASAETAMSTFIELLEQHGADEAVFAFQEIAASLRTAGRVAEEGSAKVFSPK